MPSPKALLNKVTSILNRYAPADRTIYKRIVTNTGDALIGRTTASVADTLMSPQPYANRIGRQHVPGGHDFAETVIDSSGNAVLADDWLMICSPAALSQAELQNPTLEFVFIDSSGVSEVMKLIDVDSNGFQDTDVLYSLYLRSVTRP